jgi:uncharacterized protein (TIGR00369 family)
MTSDQTPAESGPATDLTVEQLNAANADTLLGLLGIRVVEAAAERVVMTMPVTSATRQALGLLHGGATVTLAESAATIGTYLGIDPAAFLPVAIEINCNHLRSKREGVVRAVATPLHRGRRNWVWEIRVDDEADTLIAIARCTIGVVPMR